MTLRIIVEMFCVFVNRCPEIVHKTYTVHRTSSGESKYALIFCAYAIEMIVLVKILLLTQTKRLC